MITQLRTLGSAIKFSHSIFAMPFALASFILATRREAGVDPMKLMWVVVAMVGARTAAMAWNRVVDAKFDAANPRTSAREIPRGVLSRGHMTGLGLVGASALAVASFNLNPLCFALSPVALAIVLGYSYTKRFTSLSHVVLGISLAIAPVGAWLAVRGRFEAPAFVLGFAVLFWVAGFDVLYACQDEAFDRENGLRSIPARFGASGAFAIARTFHVVALIFLAALSIVEPLHGVYALGCLIIAALFVYEHSLVTPHDLSRMNAAFFLVNGWIGILFLVAVAAEVWLA